MSKIQEKEEKYTETVTQAHKKKNSFQMQFIRKILFFYFGEMLNFWFVAIFSCVLVDIIELLQMCWKPIFIVRTRKQKNN